MAWWLMFAREMMSRTGTFFDQEAVEDYADQAGEGGGRMKAMTQPDVQPSDEDIVNMLSDETNPFAPRRGECVDQVSQFRGQRLGDDIKPVLGIDIYRPRIKVQ